LKRRSPLAGGNRPNKTGSPTPPRLDPLRSALAKLDPTAAVASVWACGLTAILRRCSGRAGYSEVILRLTQATTLGEP
jgi:hypothetical protein